MPRYRQRLRDDLYHLPTPNRGICSKIRVAMPSYKSCMKTSQVQRLYRTTRVRLSSARDHHLAWEGEQRLHKTAGIMTPPPKHSRTCSSTLPRRAERHNSTHRGPMARVRRHRRRHHHSTAQAQTQAHPLQRQTNSKTTPSTTATATFPPCSKQRERHPPDRPTSANNSTKAPSPSHNHNSRQTPSHDHSWTSKYAPRSRTSRLQASFQTPTPIPTPSICTISAASQEVITDTGLSVGRRMASMADTRLSMLAVRATAGLGTSRVWRTIYDGC